MKTTEPDLLPLIDCYHDRLKRFVLVTVRDTWAAEDIVQEAFLRAHGKIHTLRDEGSVLPWLFQIAYRLCADHFRALTRRTEDETADPAALKPPQAPSLEDILEQRPR